MLDLLRLDRGKCRRRATPVSRTTTAPIREESAMSDTTGKAAARTGSRRYPLALIQDLAFQSATVALDFDEIRWAAAWEQFCCQRSAKSESHAGEPQHKRNE